MRLLLLFLLITSVALAQQPASPAGTLTRSQQAAIREEARKQVNNLQVLLNAISFADLSEYEVNEVIKNSFLPGGNQLFLNDGVIIEDDIDPKNVGLGTPSDIPVETYLRNVNLFYTKTEKSSIIFSAVIAKNEQVGSRSLVKVYFTSTFNGKHTQITKPYQSTQRVAEFQVEYIDKQWRVLITHLGFVSPTTPTYSTSTTAIPPPLLDSTKQTPNTIVNIKIPPDPKVARYRRQGWLMIAGGVASFVGGYLFYNNVRTAYEAYTSRVNVLNADYNQWRGLSRQPVGSPISPISLPAYAGSGGYVIYGAGAAGLGLNITGIAKLFKAKRMGKKSTSATEPK